MPTTPPNPLTPQIDRMRQVVTKTRLGRSTIYEMLDPQHARHEPSFPRPFALSVSIMVQEEIFNQYQQSSRGKTSRAAGLLARCLLANPESTQGFRQMRLIDYNTSISMERFHERIEQLHRRALASEEEEKGSPRPVIELSLDAKWKWIEFYNCIETMQAPGGHFNDIQDFASKIAENAARIAGIFYLMSDATGPLSAELMQSALTIASWYVDEFKRLLGNNAVPQEVEDAKVLEKWFRDRLPYPNPSFDIGKSYITNRIPYSIRGKGRLDSALHVLQMHRLVALYLAGKKTVIRFYAQPYPIH